MKKLFFIAFVCIIMFGCSQKEKNLKQTTLDDNKIGTTNKAIAPKAENSNIGINTSDNELLNDSEIEIDTSDEELLNEELNVTLDSLDDW